MTALLVRYWPQALALSLALLGGVMLGSAVTEPFAHSRGVMEGRAQLAAEIAMAALQAEQQRTHDDAALQSLSDRDLCLRALRARGLPVDSCASLRGLPLSQPQP